MDPKAKPRWILIAARVKENVLKRALWNANDPAERMVKARAMIARAARDNQSRG